MNKQFRTRQQLANALGISAKTIPFLIVIVFAYGCREKSDETPSSKQHEYHFKRVVSEADEWFPTFSIKQNGAVTTTDIKIAEDARKRAVDLSPISQPVSNARISSDEREEAVVKYKNFVRQNAGDDLLVGYFRNKYAAVLLKDYKLLESGRINDISYFTEELIASKYGQYKVVLECLRVLKSDADNEKFEALRLTTEGQIEKSLKTNREVKRRAVLLSEKVKKDPTLIKGDFKPDFIIALNELDYMSGRIERLENYLSEVKRM